VSEYSDEELGRRLAAHFDAAARIEAHGREMARHATAFRGPRPGRVAAGAAVAAIALLVVIGFPLAGERSRTSTASASAAGASTAPTSSAVASAVDAGCEVPAMPYADPKFTPVVGRLGPASFPISQFGQIVPGLDALPPDAGYRIPATIPEGLSLELIQLVTVPAATGEAPIDSLGLYYGHGPVDGTFEEFIADGGVAVSQQSEHLWDADTVAAEYDATDRGYSRIQIGPHDAVVHLGDPILRDDLRPWGIYWYDGTREWTVTGAVDPIELIEMAQSLYCAPG
jgi:hypothetical protein